MQQFRNLALKGRKRRLNLTLISHYPEQIDPDVFKLITNYVVHRMSNPATVSDLRKTMGLTEQEAKQIHTLEPGQAIALFPDQWKTPSIISVTPGRYKTFDPNQ
ncbi:MAG: ATP-binding protein [SAR202 cluster bacterium]|nr:ATP-binding protein [SAR202 cluster bacterium]